MSLAPHLPIHLLLHLALPLLCTQLFIHSSPTPIPTFKSLALHAALHILQLLALHLALHLPYTQPCICPTPSPAFAIHPALHLPYTQPCISPTLSPIPVLSLARSPQLSLIFTIHAALHSFLPLDLHPALHVP